MEDTINNNQEQSENLDKQAENKPLRNIKGQLLPGYTANPKGRPKGTTSPITRVKQIFEESPEEFDAFIKNYMADPLNRKHIVEMIDGKPVQDVTSKGEKIIPDPIYGKQSIQIRGHYSDKEDIQPNEEN